jgi:membrane protein DedA with SNARE-associated domain/membrane-associated phospholipid phosphatase
LNLEHSVQTLLHYFSQHQRLGLCFAFLMAFLEALPIIGTIIPGSVFMTMIGILIGTDILPGYLTFSIVCIGAYVGDLIGFGLGKKFHRRIPTLWPFNKHLKWLDKGEQFVAKHGGKSIIIGRFFGPIRSTVPMMAGILKMRWIVFLFAAIPAAAFWAALYMGPGILLGNLANELPANLVGEVIAYGLAAIILTWFVFWIFEHFFSKLNQLYHYLTNSLWSALSNKKHKAKILKFCTNQDNLSDHQSLALLIMSLILIIVFLSLFSYIILHQQHSINLGIFYFLQSIHTAGLTTLEILTTNLGFYKLILISSALIFLILCLQRQWRAALCLFLAVMFGMISIILCKTIYHSPRPTGFVLVKKSSSFPSGHMTMATILYSILAYYTAIIFDKKGQKLIYYIAGLLLVCIGASRLYLGAHWLTDIIGATLLGFCIVFASLIIFRQRRCSQLSMNKTGWLVTVLACILIPWGIYSYKHTEQQRNNSQKINETRTISLTDWLKKPTHYLPVYRKSRFGNSIQPLNVQWLGELNNISQQLQTSGFKRIPVAINLKQSIKNIKETKRYQLPTPPWLFQEQAPILLMEKKINKNLFLEIRLWPTNLRINNSNLSLYIGAINYHKSNASTLPKSRYKAIFYQLPGNPAAKNTLINLDQYYATKLIHSNGNSKRIILKNMDWDKKIIIITPKNTK